MFVYVKCKCGRLSESFEGGWWGGGTLLGVSSDGGGSSEPSTNGEAEPGDKVLGAVHGGVRVFHAE